MRKARLDSYKILAAANALQTFTVETIQRHADVTAENVYQVLKRDRNYFEVVEEIRGTSGRPVKRYRIIPAQQHDLQERIELLRTDLGRVTNVMSRSPAELRTGLPVEIRTNVPPELAAAEYAVLCAFPIAGAPEEQVEILSRAQNDLQKVREQLLEDSAVLSRAKAVQAIFGLCVLERMFKGDKGTLPRSVFWEQAANEIQRRLLDAIPNLEQEHAIAFHRRCLDSPVFHEMRVGECDVFEAIVNDDAWHLSPQFSEGEANESIPTSHRRLGEVRFYSTDMTSKALFRVADGIRQAVENVGLRFEVLNCLEDASPGTRRPTNTSFSVILIGCNSGRDSTSFPEVVVRGMRKASETIYFLDVDSKVEFMRRVYQSGAEYVPHAGALGVDGLVCAVKPLSSLVSTYRTIRSGLLELRGAASLKPLISRTPHYGSE